VDEFLLRILRSPIPATAKLHRLHEDIGAAAVELTFGDLRNLRTEKRGKEHVVPVHHTLEEYLDGYLAAAPEVVRRARIAADDQALGSDDRASEPRRDRADRNLTAKLDASSTNCCQDLTPLGGIRYHQLHMKARTATMNVSLPAPLRARLDEKVQKLGSYGSTSEYVRELIRRDLQRDAIAHVDALLAAGLASGRSEPVNAAWWEERRADLARHRRERAKKARKRA
jgi:antitoxin ParD1/3/4